MKKLKIFILFILVIFEVASVKGIEKPQEPFNVSFGATGAFYTSDSILLEAHVICPNKISKIVYYEVDNAGNEKSLNVSPSDISGEKYQLILNGLPEGQHRIKMKVWDSLDEEREAEVTFQIQHTNRYDRGFGDDDQYISSIITLDGEQGISLDFIDDFRTIFPKKTFPDYPWFLRVDTEEKTPIKHLKVEENGDFSYEPVNYLPKIENIQTGTIPPMVAFGQEGGGSPLYIDNDYSFGLNGVGQNMISASPVIKIEVFRKSDFLSGKKLVNPIITKNYSLPNFSDVSNFCTNFISKGNVQNYYIDDKIDDTTVGFTTRVEYLPYSDWGQNCMFPLKITHRASNDFYYYRISIKGLTLQELSGIQDSEWRLIPMSAQENSDEPQYNISYTLDFSRKPALYPKDILEPGFQGTFLPSYYTNKTIEELIDNIPAVEDNLPPPTQKEWKKWTEVNHSPELKSHPELDKLVSDLENDPLAIANYVSNEIDLQDTVANMDNNINRDALGVYTEGEGSPIEQCALLIYMLRKAGYPAVYCFGYTELLDIEASKFLKTHLRGSPENNNKFADLVEFDYPWVVTYIQGKWIHLFPWIKDTEIKEGKNIWSYFPPQYNNSRKWTLAYLLNDPEIRSLSEEDNPGTLFPLFAEKCLHKYHLTLDDVGIYCKNRPHNYRKWKDFPRPWGVSFITQDNITCSLDKDDSLQNPKIKPLLNSIFTTCNISIFDNSGGNEQEKKTPALEIGPIRLVDLHNRRFLFYHEIIPETNPTEYKLIISLESYIEDKISKGTLFTFNKGSHPDPGDFKAAQKIETKLKNKSFCCKITYDSKGIEDSEKLNKKDFYFQLKKGSMAALAINYGRVTQKMEDMVALKYWHYQQENQKNEHNSIDKEQSLGRLLHLVGQSYYHDADKFMEKIDQLTKVIKISSIGFGFSSLDPVTDDNENPLIKKNTNGTEEICLAYPKVDMHVTDGINTIHPEELNRPFHSMNSIIDLDCLEESAQEHRTINGFFNQDLAVSTIRLLDIAQGWDPKTKVAKNPGNREENLQKKTEKVQNIKELRNNFRASGVFVLNYDNVIEILKKLVLDSPQKEKDDELINPIIFWQSLYNQNILKDILSPFPYDLQIKDKSIDIYPRTSVEASSMSTCFNTVIVTPGLVGLYPKKGRSLVGIGAFILTDNSISALIACNRSIYNGGMGAMMPSPFESSNNWLQNNQLTQSCGGGYSLEQNDLSNQATEIMEQMKQQTMMDLIMRNPIQDCVNQYVANSSNNSNNWNSIPIGENSSTPESHISNTISYLPSTSNPNSSYYDFAQLSTGEKQLLPDTHGKLVNWGTAVNDAVWGNHLFEGLPNYGPKVAQFNFLEQDQGDLGISSFYNWGRDRIADPVSPTIGEFYIDNIDLTLTGPMPLDLRRSYASKNQANSSFGFGWKLTDFPYLGLSIDNQETPTLIYAAEADGSVIAYRYQEGSDHPKVWIPNTKDNPTLFNSSDQELGQTLRSKNIFNNRIIRTSEEDQIKYELHGCDGTIRHYLVREYPLPASPEIKRRRPYLEKWEDGNGNSLHFEMGSNSKEEDWGELKIIRANNGNNIHFNYDLYGHITDAFTSDGRHVKYLYDGFGDLVEVTLPDGSITKYTYEHKVAPAIEQKKTAEKEASEKDPKPDSEESQKPQKPSGPTPYSTHLIIKEEKPEGRLLENVYDAERRVTIQSARTGVGAEVKANATFHYDLTQNEDKTYTGTTSVTDVLGNIMYYKIEGGQVVEEINQNGETTRTQWEVSPNSRQKISQTDLRGLKTEYHYDDRGNLLQVTQTGNLTGKNNTETATTSLTYTANNLLESITNPLGEKTIYAYSDQAHPFLPTSITAPGSLTTQQYQDQGENGISACGLLAQVNNNGAVTKLTYDTHGFLKSKKEETGTHDPDLKITYQSNRRGEIISTTLPSGTVIRNDYDAMGHPTWKETYDPSGNIIDWEYTYYNGNGEPTWHQGAQFNPVDYSYQTYDHMGRVTQESVWQSQARSDGSCITDAGVATTFHVFDDYGNELQTVDHNHNMTTMTYDKVGNMLDLVHRQGDNPNSPILSSEYFTYQPGGDVIKHVTPLGATEQMSYNSRGQVVAKTQADGTTVAYRYDLLGRVVEELLPSGARWSTSYNDTEHLVTKSYHSSTGSKLGEEKRHYDARGNLLTLTDLMGNTFTKTYDGLNRVKSETGPHDPNSPAQTTFHIYNDIRNSQDIVNGQGEHTLSFLDSLGRPIWQGTYNRGGDLATESSDWYAPDHHSQIHNQGSGKDTIETTTYFDEAKRTVITRSGNEPPQINNFDPNGNLISSRDELGHETNWEYDGLNRAIVKILPSSNGAEPASVASEYDPAGNLITQILPEGIVDHFEYNQAGQKLHQFTQDRQGKINNEYSYSYGTNGNAAGKLASSSDPRGFTTSYSYDDWGNLAKQQSQGGNAPSQNQITSYSYDPRGLLTSLSQITPGSDSTQITRSYDAYEQLIGEQISINNKPFTSWQQNWDPAGRRVSLGVSLGGKTKTSSSQNPAPAYSFDYNALGAITTSSNNLNKGNQVHYSYNSAGLLQQRENPYLKETLRRDTRGRIMGREVSGNSGNLLTETMSWEPNNQMASYNSAAPGGEPRNMVYQYNGRGALLSEQTGANTATGNHHAFQYLYDQNPLQTGESREDGLNILTTQIVPTFNNSLLNHQVTAQSDLGQVIAEKVANSITENDYDIAGNTTAMVDQQGVSKALTWDSLNRLIRVDQTSGEGSSNWKTIYDGLGRRLQTSYKTGEGTEQTIKYYYDPNVSFMELGHSVFSQSGNQTTWNLYGPDRSGSYGGMQGIGGLDLVTTITNGDSHTHGLLNNSFGDATAKIAANGTVTPYQTTLSSFGPVDTPNEDLEPEWRGHYLDSTGFYYFGARYYDPSGGRFLSQDPMGRNASMSLYDYCGNDPVNALDPDGRLGKGVSAGWAGGEGQFKSVYDSSVANNKYVYGTGWVVGATFSDIYATANWLGTGINDTAALAEQTFGLPPDSLTGAAFALEPELALPKISEGIVAIKGYASSWGSGGEVLETTEAISPQGMSSIDNTIESIEKFFKGHGEVIRNSDGDAILMKGNRKIRFDINDPHGDSPHFHIEEKNLNGRWKDAGSEHRYYFKE